MLKLVSLSVAQSIIRRNVLIFKRLIIRVLFLELLCVCFSEANAQTAPQNVILQYTATGTKSFTIPNGVTAVTAEAWGGGGAGGRANSSGAVAGGGGGGAYAGDTKTVSGGSLSITVGAGGRSEGTDPIKHGAASSIAYGGTTFVLAAGGNTVPHVPSGGATAAGATGGQAASSTGAVRFSGGKGGNSTSGSGSYHASGGGGGGAGSNGAGGVGGNGKEGGLFSSTVGGAGGTGASLYGGNGGAGVGSGGKGSPGNNYGGGGGGSKEAALIGGAQDGGNGAQGRVGITLTIVPPVIVKSGSSCYDLTSGYTSTSGVSYQWYRNGGAISGATSPSLDATATGAGNYTLTVTYSFLTSIYNQNNTPSSVSTTSVAYSLALPQPAITAVSQACVDDWVSLSTGAGFNAYQWSFTSGAGGSMYGAGTANTEQFTWNVQGTKEVSVTVTDSNGCTGTATKEIVIIPQTDTGPMYRLPNNN